MLRDPWPGGFLFRGGLSTQRGHLGWHAKARNRCKAGQRHAVYFINPSCCHRQGPVWFQWFQFSGLSKTASSWTCPALVPMSSAICDRDARCWSFRLWTGVCGPKLQSKVWLRFWCRDHLWRKWLDTARWVSHRVVSLRHSAARDATCTTAVTERS